MVSKLLKTTIPFKMCKELAMILTRFSNSCLHALALKGKLRTYKKIQWEGVVRKHIMLTVYVCEIYLNLSESSPVKFEFFSIFRARHSI